MPKRNHDRFQLELWVPGKGWKHIAYSQRGRTIFHRATDYLPLTIQITDHDTGKRYVGGYWSGVDYNKPNHPSTLNEYHLADVVHVD